jgi:hypothetical protein
MTEKHKDIIIANPMYDVVFKHMMTADKENARYFVGTVLGEEITEIDFAPQEYTYDKQATDTETKSPVETIKIIRLDFVVTIRTKGGEDKKVLIEIQQFYNYEDITRFRIYLGEQYINEGNIVKEGDKIVNVLPIVVIYMLGSNIPEIPDVAVKTERIGKNVLSGDNVNIKCPIVDSLTHDAYFVQVSRLKKEMYENWEKCSELMMLLSLFEQNHFVNEKYTKKYPYPITNKNLIKMKDALIYAAADPKIRRIMQEERLAKLSELSMKQRIAEKNNTITQQGNTITQQGNTITQQGNTIAVVSAERDNARNTIAQQAQELEEYRRRYGSLNGMPN